MNKKIIKIILDIILFVIFLILMSEYLIPSSHLWIGFSSVILLICHNLLNINWYKALFKGKYNIIRIFQTSINLLMILSLILCIVSGILILPDIFIMYELNVKIHIITSAWSFILISIHIGFNLNIIVSVFNKNRFKNVFNILFKIIAIILFIIGIYVFFDRRFYEEMFLLIDFQKEYDYSKSLIIYILESISLASVFILLAYYFKKICLKTKMKKILLIMFIFLLTLSGCTKNTTNDDKKDDSINDIVYSENEIKITAGDTVLYATMYDNQTAKNFLNTLPFTLPTIERSGLAKGIHLNDYIEYESDKLTRDYKLGEIGYWPGGDIAIFYTEDLFEQTIVDVVQIGIINLNVDIFKTYDGSVTIEKVPLDIPLENISNEYTTKANNQGKIENFVYQSGGFKKNCNVYIPYNYDSSNKYNIFYMMHGGGGNINTYLSTPSLKDILDNMIEKNKIDPVIVVFPTFYNDNSDDYSTLTKIFHNELLNDLIPSVEKKYHTYADSVDLNGIEASRMHRAFGGFSMGGVTTWYTFINCLDYFAYFLPMSGDCWQYTPRGDENDAKITAQLLLDVKMNSKYRNEFFIHAITGDEDIAYPYMTFLMNELKKYKEFDGYIKYSVFENANHTSYYAKVYVYNILPTFFKGFEFNKYEIKSSELIVNIGNQKIYGVCYMPIGINKKLKSIILSHGYGGNYTTNENYAKEFAKIGYFTYVFDFRGGSASSRSDGSTLEMSIFTEEDDLKCIVKAISNLDFVDKNNIYLFGTSQGGLVSAMVASDLKEQIKGLILLYPAFVLVDNAKSMYKNVDEIPNSTYFLWMNVGRTYFEKLLDYDPYKDVNLYTYDVLILHGDMDNIVPISYSYRALDVYKSVNLKVINGAGHGFYGDDFNLALNYSINYLKMH